MTTDWNKLGKAVESITKDKISGGTEFAQAALEQILGEEWIKQAVDVAISKEKSAELAMNCLRHISSTKAAEYAYTIYKTNTDPEKRSMAVWLIKHLAVSISFQWVEEFLNDKNVSAWGLGVLDQLIWNEQIDYNTEKTKIDFLLELALQNSKEQKQEIEFIKRCLKERNT